MKTSQRKVALEQKRPLWAIGQNGAHLKKLWGETEVTQLHPLCLAQEWNHRDVRLATIWVPLSRLNKIPQTLVSSPSERSWKIRLAEMDLGNLSASRTSEICPASYRPLVVRHGEGGGHSSPKREREARFDPKEWHEAENSFCAWSSCSQRLNHCRLL